MCKYYFNHLRKYLSSLYNIPLHPSSFNRHLCFITGYNLHMIFLPATAVARTRDATTDADDGGAIGESNDLGDGMIGGESHLRDGGRRRHDNDMLITIQRIIIGKKWRCRKFSSIELIDTRTSNLRFFFAAFDRTPTSCSLYRSIAGRVRRLFSSADED